MATKFRRVNNNNNSRPSAASSKMPRPCGVVCCKVFLIILNVLFLLSGAAILGLGIWMQFSEGSSGYMEIIHDASCSECSKAIEYLRVPYLLMAVGGFVAVLSFLGCCGACAESSCFLCLYAMLLFLILLSEVVCTILILVFKSQITKCLECSMQHQVKFQYNQTEGVPGVRPVDRHNKTSIITLAWDEMQVQLECCGSLGPKDYYHSAWFNYTRKKTPTVVPPTCCKLSNRDPKNPIVVNKRSCQTEARMNIGGTLTDPDEFSFLKGKGCHEAFLEWLKKNLYIAICLLLGIIILQVLDAIAACLLLSRIRNEQVKPPFYREEDY